MIRFRNDRRLFPALAVAAFGLLTPELAPAQAFVEFHLGAAVTPDADVSARRTERTGGIIFGSTTTTSATRKVDFDTSVTFGGRVGYWFEGTPWFGLALDMSPFQANAGGAVDATVVPVSFLLMLRGSLLEDQMFTKGRLQPYVGIGPGVFDTTISVDFRPDIPEPLSDLTDQWWGFDARAGVRWHIHRRIAVIGEYRFTRSPVEAHPLVSSIGEAFANRIGETVEFSMQTHHLLTGLSFSFWE